MWLRTRVKALDLLLCHYCFSVLNETWFILHTPLFFPHYLVRVDILSVSGCLAVPLFLLVLCNCGGSLENRAPETSKQLVLSLISKQKSRINFCCSFLVGLFSSYNSERCTIGFDLSLFCFCVWCSIHLGQLISSSWVILLF